MSISRDDTLAKVSQHTDAPSRQSCSILKPGQLVDGGVEQCLDATDPNAQRRQQTGLATGMRGARKICDNIRITPARL